MVIDVAPDGDRNFFSMTCMERLPLSGMGYAIRKQMRCQLEDSQDIANLLTSSPDVFEASYGGAGNCPIISHGLHKTWSSIQKATGIGWPADAVDTQLIDVGLCPGRRKRRSVEEACRRWGVMNHSTDVEFSRTILVGKLVIAMMGRLPDDLEQLALMMDQWRKEWRKMSYQRRAACQTKQ